MLFFWSSFFTKPVSFLQRYFGSYFQIRTIYSNNFFNFYVFRYVIYLFNRSLKYYENRRGILIAFFNVFYFRTFSWYDPNFVFTFVSHLHEQDGRHFFEVTHKLDEIIVYNFIFHLNNRYVLIVYYHLINNNKFHCVIIYFVDVLVGLIKNDFVVKYDFTHLFNDWRRYIFYGVPFSNGCTTYTFFVVCQLKMCFIFKTAVIVFQFK